MIGIDDLIAEDMRRSFAQLGYKGGIPITKFSELLGHSSIATTLEYINLENEYGMTVLDFIPLNGG